MYQDTLCSQFEVWSNNDDKDNDDDNDGFLKKQNVTMQEVLLNVHFDILHAK